MCEPICCPWENLKTYGSIAAELIDEVGKDGGILLTTGCECPVDAKFENVKMMIDTAKNYRGKY